MTKSDYTYINENSKDKALDVNINNITEADLFRFLTLPDSELEALVNLAAKIKEEYVGNTVYYRGLIEYSNICSKNCLYCGIRACNTNVARYELSEEEVVNAARFAAHHRYSNLVIQSGERSDKEFRDKIARLLSKIHSETDNKLRITLSLGEHPEETYRLWKECGADRYLLRIETSSEDLYKKLHPADGKHSYKKRVQALETLKKLNYQVGSGVMIGLPFQTTQHLVNDLLFLKNYDIDMVGMGPYIEHHETPLYEHKDILLPKNERFLLGIKMVASLRILMKDINIAATTAMQALNPNGREMAIMAGANVIMPNITPLKYRKEYLLYEDKPCIDEDSEQCLKCLEKRITSTGNQIGYDSWGDSKHFTRKGQ
jgi:biotin synthase